MAYVVRIAARAERDLVSLYEEIDAPDSAAARRWYRGLKEAILSLAKTPNRCPVTPENSKLRHLLYGENANVYRVVFRVDRQQQQVDVLHIRHGARRKFRASDLK
jgi:plasmid stabilization system protein ParE